MFECIDKDVIKSLKKNIRGRIVVNESLAPHTSLGIGGPADIWVEPADVKELKKVLILAKERKIPFFIIGLGSNLLVNDAGIRGMVIHLGAPYFKKAKISDNTVTARAGYNVSRLVRLCCNKGLEGLESLIGIPGTIGGALTINAGGSGNPIYKNIGDFVTSVKVMDYGGNIKRLTSGEIKFGYRSANLNTLIALEVTFRLKPKDSTVLNSMCVKFLNMKCQKQALDMRSAGCVFKNPENFQFTCGQMIDMLGLKGKRIGGAEVSAKHANFIVNKDNATAKDVMGLIEFIKEKVKENYNISLELEIKLV